MQPAKGLIRIDGNITKNRLDLPSNLGKTGGEKYGRMTSNQMYYLSHWKKDRSFAGDAYKNRDLAPTFQREWGKRIMRLSKAEIPTILLVGNHDVSPSVARAHAMEEFSTLSVPRVLVVDKPAFLGPNDLKDLCAPGKQLDMQLLAVPWVSRSGLMAYLNFQTRDLGQLYEEMEKRLSNVITKWLDQADPNLPTILTAHATVEGAVYGGERTVL